MSLSRDADSAKDIIDSLLSRIEELESEVEELKSENLKLENSSDYWKEQHDDLEEHIALLQQELEQSNNKGIIL